MTSSRPENFYMTFFFKVFFFSFFFSFFFGKSRGETIDQKCHVKLTVPGLSQISGGRVTSKTWSKGNLVESEEKKKTPLSLTRGEL